MTRRVPLHARDGTVRAFARVDDADLAAVIEHSWSLGCRNQYAVARIGGKVQTLHRFLLGLSPGDSRQGDHINHDKLDNRRANLRVVTPSGNQQNRHGPNRGNPSGFRGVSRTATGRWRARVESEGRSRSLGCFTDPAEAAAAATAWRAAHMPYSTDARSQK